MTRNDQTVVVRTADDVLLDGEVLTPSGAPRGTLVVLHAMMADRRSMDRPPGCGLASELVAEGWRVVNANFRGRGLHGRRAGWHHDWSYEDLVARDLPAWVELARSLGDGPVGVLGHSLGGHVTAASWGAGHVRIDGLMLVAANIWLPGLEPSRGRRVVKKISLAGFAGMSRLVGRVPARSLGIGPADEARRYALDLAVPMWTGRWESGAGKDWWRAWGDVSGPVGAWIGAGDRLLAHPVGAGAFARQGGAEVHVVGDGGCGVAGRPGHMALVTDEGSRPAWQHMASWASRWITGVGASRAAG